LNRKIPYLVDIDLQIFAGSFDESAGAGGALVVGAELAHFTGVADAKRSCTLRANI
jgi:hypothetical protein